MSDRKEALQVGTWHSNLNRDNAVPPSLFLPPSAALHCMLALVNLKNEPILSMSNPQEWNDIDLRMHVYILYVKICTYLDYINL